MGVLRIKDNVDELLEKDPYELFSVDEPHQIARRLRPEFWGAAFLGVLIAFGIALVAFLNVQRDGQGAGDTPFAYFEIKAIDPEGHPVTGAVVKDGDKSLGVTDSFGEWRRFMRVRLGATVALTISKRTEDGPLIAVKNMAVPARLPESGDLELTGSVQLARGGAIRGVPVSRENRRAAAKRAATPDAAPSEAVPTPVDRAAVALASDALPTSIWFMAQSAGPAARPELIEVVQALRRRALELGMRVDPESALRVRLTDILVARKTDARPERRLLVVDGRQVAGDKDVRLFSYLREYQDVPLRTARDILWSATMHLSTSHQVAPLGDGTYAFAGGGPALWSLAGGRVVLDAAGQAHPVTAGVDGLKVASAIPGCEAGCRVTTPGISRQAPVAGWKKLKMRLAGLKPEADVYVSGYEARRLGDDIFEYWGNAAAGVNVTVVEGARLVYRGRAEATTRALPSPMAPTAAAAQPLRATRL